MSDYNKKIEELKRELRMASNLRQVGNVTRKKYKNYGLNQTAASKYQPAKIIECRQNVVELRKLINDWCKLEKAKKSSLDQMEREKWAFETEFGRILGEETDSGLQESFLLEPGFRFKANGDFKKPKRSEITNVAQCVKNWKNVKSNLRKGVVTPESTIKCHSESLSNISDTDPIHRVSKENAISSPKFDGKTKERRLSKDTDTIIGTVNVTKAIEETEKALNEIYDDREIKLLRAKSEGLKSSSTFLRAMSKENQYSGGPDAVKRRYEMTKILAAKDEDGKCIKSKTEYDRGKFKNNCQACACKLRGYKDDFIDKKLKQLKKPMDKWKTVSLNPSTDSIYSNARAVKSMVTAPRSQSCVKSGPKAKGSRLTRTSPQKSMEKETSKPASVPYISKVEIKKKEHVLHTKSTVDVEQTEWQGAETVGDGECDIDKVVDELTPRSRERLTRIARELLQRVPNSDSHSKPGVFSKSKTAEDLRYTEPLFHRMMERNSVSNKYSLEMFDEDDQADFISRHLENVDVLVRGMRLDNRGDVQGGTEFKDKKQMAEKLKQNIDKNRRSFAKNRKTSSSAMKVMKEIAEMNRQASESKISNFIQKLPPPPVSIERWRSHDGVNRSVFETYAPRPAEQTGGSTGGPVGGPEGSQADEHEPEEIDLDYEKDPFVVNPDLLLQELDECKLIPQTAFGSLEPTQYGSAH